MSLNLGVAIQSQMLQTLLQALQTADQPSSAGTTIEAKFMGWSDPAAPAAASQGKPALANATILFAGRPTTMLIEATPERRALMQPGAILTLQIDAPASEAGPAQMRLLAIQPAHEMATGQITPQPPAMTDEALVPLPKPIAPAALAARDAAGPVIGAALARQNGLGALYADLDLLVRSPVPLPAMVADAASRALGMRTDAAALGAHPEALRPAVAASGLFHEALLARNAPADAAADLKGALIMLKQALKEALGPVADDLKLQVQGTSADKLNDKAATRQSADASSAVRPQAATRDGLPVPQGIAIASIDASRDTQTTMMGKALERTEGALDRISVNQFASLPASGDVAPGAPVNRWFTELPLALDGRTAVLPLEIEEDHGGGSASGPQAKLWRVRFALDFEPMGPLHAMVTMQGRAIGVTVWAERAATSQLVRDHAPDLKAALLDSDFDNPQIEVLAGQPTKRAAHAGHYLDRCS